MSKIDLSRYAFDGGTADSIADLTTLSNEDKQRLLYAGIDVNQNKLGGSFMHMNHSGVHCQSRQEGLEIMDIKDAYNKYDGLPEYWWKMVDPDKDEFTRAAHEHLHGGYFIRARKGVKVQDPVQSCLFIKDSGLAQNVHNIVVVEEGAELHVLSGCATAHGAKDTAHMGISEFYVKKGGKLTFTMIHNWGDDTAVRPRSGGVMEEDCVFLSNYVLLKPVRDLQMYPSITLNGSGSVARFNSVMVTPPGSYVDAGNRIILNAPDTRAEIIARTLTTGGTVINRGFIGGYNVPAKGHLECKGLILGGGRIHAIPELDATIDGVELSHEAAVGKIAQEEIEYLMARGMDEDEATSTIVRGFLNVDIMGLPHELEDAIRQQIDQLDAGDAM
ncbi:SufBD protein [Oleidesulfovibrio alaskensis G20]|jgi:Fe-S cluster assembly scaffold protein SufB|uniref:SufBD protein n=1 Tax=Oleidesulfovibrio alaskensis (strain ATCC BAA-1058 / DSM 17464 / G20) TaxID=207559 RepID=Q312A3_OLEA2|nr:SufD family Fe-S cluster assembly protein [Oleidesulfovibrio alaskensis]ABB38243.1 SufBD protein [Oleidesulfovibrio alaskensis G20]MBG0774290.1 SufD family Fe-S cluster assembly protein [Oleidesulfovibrio alaskensis]MBL3581183.1 SufD family Fe-S cluster assembly protein [Oleidesulfovibrio alaskensis]